MAAGELAERAHRGLIDWYRLSTERTPGARMEASGDELLIDPPHPFPFLRTAVRAGDAGASGGLVERAAAFFGPEPGFVVYARASGEDDAVEEAARAAGLTLFSERYPEMACERPVEMPAHARGAELREVASAQDEAAYWRVCDAAYPSLGFPAGVFSIYGEGYVSEPPFGGCIAWLDGEPAACALFAVVGGAGLVGWVATDPEQRGKGLGEACTAWVTNRIFERGGAFASLQASPMGESLYARMGYEEIYSYRLWLRPPAA